MAFGIALDASTLNALALPNMDRAVPFFLLPTATYLFYRWLRAPGKNTHQLPPGPPGLPLIGNLLQLSSDLWIPLQKWRLAYGPIVYLNVAGQPMIVLNTHKAAADLLDRRASIYSDRPRNIVASEILTGGLLVVFTRYGDVWRRMRRAAHECLNKSIVYRFHAVQADEAITLAAEMLREPDRWDDHLKRAAASMIVAVVYDKPAVKDAADPVVRDINAFVERLVRAALPGAHFVEFFTWMKHLPSWLAPWKRNAEAWHQKDGQMFEGLYLDVKDRQAKGDDRPSFAASLAGEQQRHNLSDQESAWLAGTLYAAGAETTAAVLAYFMQAMLLYPDVQARAQAELDAVVGRARPPNFSDYDQLPYIRAVVKEALRWKPIDPVGLPHRAVEDDYYEGYYIPKGSIVIANVWHLNRDPAVYGADAADFNPARHLDSEGQPAPAPADTKDEGHVTYGFGRRICVGRHVANNSLFVDIASVLWAANIRAPKDAQGRDVLPDKDGFVNNGLVVRPQPFDCAITPRFEGALAQLEEAMRHADFHS